MVSVFQFCPLYVYLLSHSKKFIILLKIVLGILFSRYWVNYSYHYFQISKVQPLYVYMCHNNFNACICICQRKKKKLLDERILNVSQSLFAKKSRFFVNDAMKILGIRGLQRGASPNTVEANCTLFSPSAIK